VPVHINLTVSDLERSADFYQKWLNFGPEDRRFPDGTVFVRDSEGTDLALHLGEVPTDAREFFFHFGFRRDNADSVRALHAELTDAGVPICEFEDEMALVSVKFSDPDGYSVEVYWER
jgi:catechol 2,3-dioxygenase-like lactoylglutathione lyase family enzyme